MPRNAIPPLGYSSSPAPREPRPLGFWAAAVGAAGIGSIAVAVAWVKLERPGALMTAAVAVLASPALFLVSLVMTAWPRRAAVDPHRRNVLPLAWAMVVLQAGFWLFVFIWVLRGGLSLGGGPGGY